MRTSLSLGSVRVLAMGFLLLLGVLPAHAQKTYRGVSGGDWFTANNWSPRGVPSSSSEVVVDVNRTVVIGSAGAVADSLILDNGATVSLSGSSATLSVDEFAFIGDFGQGTLSLSGGAKATFGDFRTAGGADATGTVTITGAGSKLTTLAANYLGSYGASTITVSEGGHYDSQAEELIMGYQNVDSGTTFTVTGSGSKLTANWTAVGNFGKATLLVSDGATVSTGDVSIAYGTADGTPGSIQGSAMVTGAGSRWDVAGSVGIGWYNSGSEYNLGSLTVAAGGAIDVGADGSGTIEVNRLSSLRIGAGGTSGTLRAGSIMMGGELVFDHTDDASFHITLMDSLSSPGSGNLIKNGSGKTTLFDDGTYSSTYAGAITVNDGTLVVNSYLSDSSVTVSDGGTLGGEGVIGTLVLAEGAILSPGNSPGVLQTADAHWLGGGTYLWEIDSATGSLGTSWDLLVAVGSLDLYGTPADPFTIAIASLNFDGNPGAVADFDPTQTYTWTIAIAYGGINGFDQDAFAIDATGFTNAPYSDRFSVSSDGTNLHLTYTAVPEPELWGILGGLGVLAIALRRRRRSR